MLAKKIIQSETANVGIGLYKKWNDEEGKNSINKNAQDIEKCEIVHEQLKKEVFVSLNMF